MPNFTPMTNADLRARYGSNEAARLFEYCDKSTAGSTRITPAHCYTLLRISGASVAVVDGAFFVGELIAGGWSDRRYEAAVHALHVEVDDQHAAGVLDRWVVQAFEAREGWVWHSHAPEVNITAYLWRVLRYRVGRAWRRTLAAVWR